MLKFITLLFASIFAVFIIHARPSFAGPEASTPASTWEDLHQEGRVSEAYVLSLQQIQGAKKEFQWGVLAFQSEKWDESLAHFQGALIAQKDMADYVHYFLGRIYMQKAEPQKALDHFKKMERATHVKFLISVAKFYQAEAHLQMKQWKSAEGLYGKVLKPLRRTKYYPSILWGTLASDMGAGKTKRVCRQAKELYLKYPSYPQIADWGIVLGENRVNGQKLNCVSTFAEQKLRLQRMMWAGMEEKVLEEIQTLQAKSLPSTKYVVNELMVNYLLQEGHVDEAQKLMAPYAATMSEDPDYLLLMAKVYSRSNLPQKGIEYYTKAANRMKGNSATSALFQAAYLSYLSHEYKNAAEMFSEFLSKNGQNHRLSADVIWYQAFIKYLQKNYEGAEKDILAINEMKKKKARQWREHKDDKLTYWLAMSYFRQNKKEKAIQLFSELTHDDSVGYYSVAAYQRLSKISQRQMASLPVQFSVHENWWLPEALANGGLKDKEEEEALSPSVDPFEQKVDALLSDEDRNVEKEEGVTLTPSDRLAADVRAVYFNNIDKTLQRAKTLIQVGEDELAYREVIETEGPKLTDKQKQWLLKAHQTIHSFNRSVVLASYFFSDQVAKLGLYHGSDYWNYSYPKAYEKSVRKFSQQWQVPPELVWSIMRAETIYRPDAISPVGARGLMQVMPKTGRKLASMTGENLVVDDLLKPSMSVKMGTFYLQRLLKKFKGNISLVAAAYNGGPHRVHGWMHYFGDLDMDEFIEHIPFHETRNYVKKVTRYYAIYNLLYHKKTDATQLLASPIGFKLDGSIPTMETWERH